MQFFNQFPARAFFNNGLFTKSAGDGTTTIGLPFWSSSQVDLAGRTVSFLRGFNETDGAVRLSGGSLTTSDYTWSGGSLDLGLNGTITVPNGLSILQGLTLTGLGNIIGCNK
jgi:hypothetical protein